MRILHKNHIKDKELLSANLTVVALMGGHLPSPQGLQIAWTWTRLQKIIRQRFWRELNLMVPDVRHDYPYNQSAIKNILR
jgi:hypothetical protein